MANQICKIRTKLGYTQCQLANELGVSQGYISDLEAGHKKNLGIDKVAKLMDLAEQANEMLDIRTLVGQPSLAKK